MSSVTPVPFSYGKVEYVNLSTDNEFDDEPMEEVDLTAEGHARYTVYRIADPDKRAMHDNEVPVFQWQDEGAGDWATLTPADIWYPVGYIVLSTPLTALDQVHCHTGHWCTSYQLFGCVARAPSDKTEMEDITCDQDTAIQRAPICDDWDCPTLEAFYAKLRSERTTDTGAANGHIKLQHLGGGSAGDLVGFEITNPGGTGSLAITVDGSNISVAAARSDDVITSTARDVINALNSDAEVAALHILASIPLGEDGSGLVAVYTHTHLEGGMDEIDYAGLVGQIIIAKFIDRVDTGLMSVGYGIIESIDWDPKPTEHIKARVKVTGARCRLYRVAE